MLRHDIQDNQLDEEASSSNQKEMTFYKIIHHNSKVRGSAHTYKA